MKLWTFVCELSHLLSIVSEQRVLFLLARPCEIRLEAFWGVFTFPHPSTRSIRTSFCGQQISTHQGRHPLTEWLKGECPGGFVFSVKQVFLCFQPVMKRVLKVYKLGELWQGTWKIIAKFDRWRFPWLYPLRDMIGCLNKPAALLYLLLKFAVIVNNFTTEWFLWMVYYLVLVTIVIQSKA